MKRKIILTLLLVVVLMLSNACTKSLVLKFENQTDQSLTIFIQSHEEDIWFNVGDVAPKETKKMDTNIPDVFDSYYIEARDASGNVLFSKEFTRKELVYDLHNTIVIPPSGG